MDLLREFVRLTLSEGRKKRVGTVTPALTDRLGKCYVLAGQYVTAHSDATLVHGSIQGFGNPRIDHAWVELANGAIYDAVWDRELDRRAHEAIFNPIVDKRYDRERVLINTLRTGHWSPWDD